MFDALVKQDKDTVKDCHESKLKRLSTYLVANCPLIVNWGGVVCLTLQVMVR